MFISDDKYFNILTLNIKFKFNKCSESPYYHNY